MSDEVECSICGRDGYPTAGCGICHGNAQVQSRAHTLSEERSNPRKYRDNERYNEDGGLGPKRANVPGADA